MKQIQQQVTAQYSCLEVNDCITMLPIMNSLKSFLKSDKEQIVIESLSAGVEHIFGHRIDKEQSLKIYDTLRKIGFVSSDENQFIGVSIKSEGNDKPALISLVADIVKIDAEEAKEMVKCLPINVVVEGDLTYMEAMRSVLQRIKADHKLVMID